MCSPQKLGVDVPETKHRFPRLAEVPFDSDYKFMATFHRTEFQGEERLIVIAKGAPDVLLARSTRRSLPHHACADRRPR